MDSGSRAKRVKATDGMIWPIDEDLLIKVLCRLPPKDLIRCSCVCKGWFGLINRYCVPQITPSLPFLGCQMRIKINSRSRVVGLASIPRVEADVDAAWPQIDKICNPIFGPGLLEEFMEEFFQIKKYLLHSCNGLMLFKHPCRCMYVLCNPNTKQFLFLGSPNPVDEHQMFAVLAVEPTWKLDRKRDFFKILGFTKDINVVKVLRSSNCCWAERKVKYNRPIDSDFWPCYGKRLVFFHGRLFTLHQSRLLLWYTIEDDNVDVVCDYVKLPKSRDHSGSMSGRKEGWCIGLCGGRLQLSRNDEGGSLQIWVFSVDTREWTFLHCVSLESLVKNPQMVHLSTMFLAVEAKFKVLAFDPISEDGVIIWTPNRIFCYYYKSGNLVSLQCPEILNGELKDPPRDTFPFTPCLIPLVYKGGGDHCIIKVAKLPDGSSATWLCHTEERKLQLVSTRKLELVSTRLCSLLL